jgi:predicted aminopeptidase
MAFARKIGLADNDNYTSFVDIGDKPISYTLVACPKDSLNPLVWSFPIVGELPYIGFFDRQDALDEANKIKKLGHDAVVWPAGAYSTLGWFSDPVLSTSLKGELVDFVDLLLHEQTHATIYVRGDITFNENLAVFIAGEATPRLLRGPRPKRQGLPRPRPPTRPATHRQSP